MIVLQSIVIFTQIVIRAGHVPCERESGEADGRRAHLQIKGRGRQGGRAAWEEGEEAMSVGNERMGPKIEIWARGPKLDPLLPDNEAP